MKKKKKKLFIIRIPSISEIDLSVRGVRLSNLFLKFDVLHSTIFQTMKTKTYNTALVAWTKTNKKAKCFLVVYEHWTVVLVQTVSIRLFYFWNNASIHRYHDTYLYTKKILSQFSCHHCTIYILLWELFNLLFSDFIDFINVATKPVKIWAHFSLLTWRIEFHFTVFL